MIVCTSSPEKFNLSDKAFSCLLFFREGTFFLVMDHFGADIPNILSELQSHPKSLFLYLKTVIEVHQSGILDLSSLTRGVDDVKAANDPSTELNAYMEKISEFPKLLRNNPVPVSDDMMEHYLEVDNEYWFFLYADSNFMINNFRDGIQCCINTFDSV